MTDRSTPSTSSATSPTSPPSPLRIDLPGGGSVAALSTQCPQPRACLVLAHGAGAGMHHPFLSQLAAALAALRVATLRYQFPFMEQGSKRPDPPAVAHQAVRAAVSEASKRLPGVPLFAGGKSFGGRMTSQAQALEPMVDVRGLVFVGFPLHASGKPSTTRAAHLADIEIPMLFLQGTRDSLADIGLVRETCGTLGSKATLRIIEGADHAFHVLVRSGRTDAAVLDELATAIQEWTLQRIAETPGRLAP